MTKTNQKQQQPPNWLPTRNQRLKRLQRTPGFLAEDLDYVFGTIKNDDEKAVHNHVLKKLARLCPDRNAMLIAVAKAIIKSSTKEAVE